MITLAKHKKGQREAVERSRGGKLRRGGGTGGGGINLKSDILLLLSNCVQYTNDNTICKKQTRKSRFFLSRYFFFLFRFAASRGRT